MKIELINIPFLSNNTPAYNHIDLPEGIHCICSSDVTILRCLFSYLTASAKPYIGTVRFLNYDVCMLGEAYKNHLSYFERYPLFPGTFPLSHYLIYTSLLQRLPPKSARKKAEYLIQEMKLDAYRDSLLAELDPDTLNRIDLYQTLLSEAPILILDDKYFPNPTSLEYPKMLSFLSSSADTKIVIILHHIITKKEDPLPDLPHTTYVIK